MKDIHMKKLNLLYCVQMGAYWSTFCCIYSYATYTMLEKGFQETSIGIIIALGNIAGVLLQPIVSGWIDRTGNRYLHKTIVVSSIISIGLMLLRMWNTKQLWLAAILFILADMLLQLCLPLTNSISGFYQNLGYPLQFGPARSCGSLIYAGVSSLLGVLVAKQGTWTVYVCGIVFLALMIVSTMLMPQNLKSAVSKDLPEASMTKDEAKKVNLEFRGENLPLGAFLASYPWFTVVLVALLLSLISHNMLNGFLIQIVSRLGGSTTEMGVVLSISAAVEVPVLILSPVLIKRFGAKKLLFLSTVFFSVKAITTMIAGTFAMLYLVQFLQMGGFALYVSSSVEFVQVNLPAKDLVRGQALMSASSVLAGVVGFLLGGYVIEQISVLGMLQVSSGFTIFGILIMAVSMKHIK